MTQVGSKTRKAVPTILQGVYRKTRKTATM